jgi:heat shock protein 1/8
MSACEFIFYLHICSRSSWGLSSIGSAAQQAFHLAPSQTIFDSKRLIGRRFMDPEVVADRERWPFVLVDNQGRPAIQIELHGRPKQFVCASS